MQKEGKPRFLKHHSNSVRGVAFSPRDRYLFCSGAYDGKVNLYSSLRMELLMSYSITTMAVAKNVNAVRFTSDGSRTVFLIVTNSERSDECIDFTVMCVLCILACTTSRRLSVVDVERGEQLLAYDNCAASGRDRTGLATDPTSPNIAVSVAVNGKGLTLLDLRMPLPLDYVYDVSSQRKWSLQLHSSTIRDIVFLESSWPWATSSGVLSTLITAGSDGCCKVCTMDGRILHTFYSGRHLNTVCPTPEPYQGFLSNGFYSVIMSGGDKITSYVPNLGIQESFCENRDKPIWKVRYTSNGSFLYSVCEGGVVRKYRRYPDRHEYLGETSLQHLRIEQWEYYV
ncbi:hypothetical protein AGLY_009350 [Aphis glycines]|uniref:Uncharacterized protein n=1 Tax=Aphis glycines TaxID=307491 RepID=A0A6G0THD0_APHGL|nr:hypothetical protein AGLY_009350 [Aphis glycines]